ncbi:hypothetical protein ACNO7T_09350 [Vibrio campbellii]
MYSVKSTGSHRNFGTSNEMNSASVTNSRRSSFASNIKNVRNIDTSSYFQKSKSVDFSSMESAIDEIHEAYSMFIRSELLPSLNEKYKSGNYQYKTVDEYKMAKSYPSGIDERPYYFDRRGRNLAVHGSNMDTVIKSIINCNRQLVPSLKQIKLQGEMPSTGISNGTTNLNQKYVSTISLSCAIDYANKSIREEKGEASSIPVVILGDGIGEHGVKSGVQNEVGYKRLNMRILSFRNEAEKSLCQKSLEDIRAVIGMDDSIRLCTHEMLTKCGNDIEAQWENSQPI